jgi:hypothetical protein
VRIEFADVLADDELLPHRLRFGIEHEPQREQRDRDRHCNHNLQRILLQEFCHAVLALMQVPPGQTQRHGQTQRE